MCNENRKIILNIMFSSVTMHYKCRVESAIMRRVVLWVTACDFIAIILKQSLFNCLITSASTLHVNEYVGIYCMFITSSSPTHFH